MHTAVTPHETMSGGRHRQDRHRPATAVSSTEQLDTYNSISMSCSFAGPSSTDTAFSAPPLSRSGRAEDSRTSKSRTGCEQCKRRKVKCDERQPTCSRCLTRGETCTGNFQCDQWQIERPWISHTRSLLPVSSRENETLRYWYNKACLNMAIFHPPVNPLSYDLATWLGHSKALRHTLECVAEAHRQHFVPERLTRTLEMRGLAIVSLQGELARIRTPSPKQDVLLRTAVLSSMLLCVSSPWLDPSGKDFGMGFLSGANGLIELIVSSNPTDPLAFYVLGLFLYWHAFSSYLLPSCHPIEISPSIIDTLQCPPFSSCVNPVTGISATLCPVLAEAGQYYRRVVNSRVQDMAYVQDLETRIRAWEPPARCPRQPQLQQLAEGYRNLGLIMLDQAKSLTEDLGPLVARGNIHVVMELLKHIPKDDPLLNWVGPALVIAGSELPSSCAEERELIERVFRRLESWTRIPTHLRSLELVEEVWGLRDEGSRITWLELMVEKGLALAMG